MLISTPLPSIRLDFMKYFLTFLLAILLLSLGYLVGRWQSSTQLQICRQKNERLSDDLVRTIARGMTVEAQLNMCKERRVNDH